MGQGASQEILLLGLPGTGKSAFLYTLKHGEWFGDSDSTGSGSNVEVMDWVLPNHQVRQFTVRELGGACKSETLAEHVPNALALIYFVDATNETTILKSAWELYYIIRLASSAVPVFVILNSKMRDFSTGAIKFESLFPLFLREHLPPPTSETELDDGTYLSSPGGKTPHGYIVQERRPKLTHTGMWNVVPLTNISDVQSCKNIFTGLAVQIAGGSPNLV